METIVEQLLYDWLGLNEWLFRALYRLNFPLLDEVWRVASYGYSYWVAAGIGIGLGYRYLRIRHAATERQLESMGEFMVGLIIAFSVVWCSVRILQNVTLMPRPWALLPDLVSVQVPFLQHEGLPASAPAISIMLACLAWRYVGRRGRHRLMGYAAAGCLLSVVSGVNWPVEVAAGGLIGWAGARLGQWYSRFARRVVAGVQ